MEATTATTINRTAQRGLLFDQFNRGLITNRELQQRLAEISLGLHDKEGS